MTSSLTAADRLTVIRGQLERLYLRTGEDVWRWLAVTAWDLALDRLEAKPLKATPRFLAVAEAFGLWPVRPSLSVVRIADARRVA